MLETCRVFGPVVNPDGTPCYPATITFTLSHRDRDDGNTIMPSPVKVSTAPNGDIEVDLWPNVEGQAGTYYIASVSTGVAGKTCTTFRQFTLVVPNAPSANLADITELVPPESVDDARAAVIQAQQAAAEALSSALDAAASAEIAANAVTQTGEDAAATAADRVQTGLDAAATAADRVATSADATATAADRIATAADRVQTGLDAAATAADRVQTGEDATATAADRTQTELDAAATAADRIATAADRTQTELDAAATAADRIATAADRVQTGLDAAATAADRIATAADRTQTELDAAATAADRIATAADRTQTELDAAATAADRVQTGLDAAATAADRVQTGLDRIATAGDVLSTAANVVVSTDAKNEALVSAQNAQSSANNATQTKALMDTALTNVTNYNNTLAQLTGGAKLVASAADVVAAFVYDTTLDSDKGAWRLKVKNASWFNEALNTATRGSRNFFPKKALIVARPASVTIYDMDNKDCPMWMVWNQANFKWNTGATATGIVALNGQVHLSTSTRAVVLDLISDTGGVRLTTGYSLWVDQVVSRNTVATVFASTVASGAIVNNAVNAVAATVLPGTPPDRNRAGLPAPTVAVGTAGGVSVIHWDGRVTNSLVTNSVGNVGFDAAGNLYLFSTGWGFRGKATPAVYAVNSFNPTSLNYTAATGAGQNTPKFLGAPPYAGGTLEKASGSAAGLIIFADSPVVPSGGAAYVNSKYNTGTVLGGPFPGLSLAESTADVTSLVGATPLNDDFSTYADTAAMLAVWNVNAGTGWSLSGGAALHATGNALELGRPATLVAGTTVRVRITLAGRTAGSITPRMVGGTTVTAAAITANGQSVRYMTVLAGNASVRFLPSSDFDGSIDDIIVDTCVADRSAAGNNPVVVGTVNRNAVATGAEMAAYSGFSASNYLELPYTSALDFGTGDFYFASWVKTTANGVVMCRQDVGAAGQRVGIDINTGVARLLYNVSTSLSGTTQIIDGNPHLVVGLRRGTSIEIWVDNRLEASGTFASSANNASAVLRLGLRPDGGTPLPGSIALPRISATAPTPAQIRAMYADEAPLFQPGAKCLLVGSDNVQGVDFDASTGLLYAAKAAGGTDVFKGLQRISTINIASEGAAMTSNNHKSVSAVNDNISIATAAEVFAKLPTVGLREMLGPNNVTPLYDRTTVKTAQAVTTNATPTVTARFPMDKGENGGWIIDAVAMEYGDPTGAEIGFFRDLVSAFRPGEGNISLSGASTQTIVRRVTATLAVTITANTTTQTIDVTATGIAAKNLVWKVIGVFRLNNEATT